jgi:hypothetical protein
VHNSLHPLASVDWARRGLAPTSSLRSLMAEKKITTLHVRIEESVAKALRELAEADDRKVSSYAARVLRQHVERAKAGKRGKA